MITTVIFIVTFKRDFQYLKFCLRSIEKFASQFAAVRILVPDEDLLELRRIVGELDGIGGIPIHCVSGKEWPGAGMMWHEAQIIKSDIWNAEADMIVHLDADCVLKDFAMPSTFTFNSKPILRYERFDSIGKRHPGVVEWQRVTERCLPFAIEYETMRGHGQSMIPETYQKTRQMISEATGMGYEDYIRGCKNDYPNGFCEFVTLGNVAMHEHQEKYWLHDCAMQDNPDFQPFPVGQFWAHAPMDKPQSIWWDGHVQMITPIEKCRELGLA